MPPPYEWVEEISSSEEEFGGSIVANNLDDGAYVAGVTKGRPNELLPWILGSPTGDFNGFLAKYDEFGTVLWATKLESSSDMQVNDLAIDPFGFIYLTGTFSSSITFTSVTGGSDQSVSANSSSDFFLVKYDGNGEVIWAFNNDDGSDDDEGITVFADATGVYLGGRMKNGSNDFDPSPFGGTSMNTSSSSPSIFIAKYPLDGSSLIWRIDGKSGSDCFIGNIESDEGELYFIGDYIPSSRFDIYDNSGTRFARLTSNGSQQIFIGSVDKMTGLHNSDNFIFALTSNKEKKGYGIAVDDDQVYFSGSIRNNTSFPSGNVNPGDYDSWFVSAHDKMTGYDNWVNYVDHSDGASISKELATIGSGEVISIGYFEGDISIQTSSLSSESGSTDILSLSYSSLGDINWFKTDGEDEDDFGVAISASVSTGDVYVTGDYEEAIDFDNDPNLGVSGSGGRNIFLGKMDSVLPLLCSLVCSFFPWIGGN